MSEWGRVGSHASIKTGQSLLHSYGGSWERVMGAAKKDDSGVYVVPPPKE